MNLASRASRLGLTVAILRILCNGLCTAQRFYVEGVEQRCRVGCLDESDSLSHYSESPLLYHCFTSVWRHATIFPRRGHLFHDLIIQNFLRSLQYGIVVMGVLDAFVHARNHHRRNIDNPGNLGAWLRRENSFYDCNHSAYAHAYQFICVAGHIPAALPSKFRLPVAKARYPHLPNARTTTREKGNDFHGWAIYIDGGTRSADGETLAGWCVVARSPHGRIYVMFGPVVRTEAHLAYAGARIHSDNTADMSAIIEALSFLGPRGPVTCEAFSCIFCDSKHAAGVLFGYNACSHTCTAWTLLPTVIIESSAQAQIYHATHLQSRGEPWKRMCGSCRRIGCIWIGVEP